MVKLCKQHLIKLLLIVPFLVFQFPLQAANLSVSIDPNLLKKPFTGRVYAVIAPKSEKSQPLQVNYWFSPVEIIAKDVKGWSGKEPLSLSREDIRYFKPTNDPDTEYEIQVLLRVNTRDADPFSSLNNIYSSALKLSSEQYANLDFTVLANQVITEDSPLAKKRPPASEQLIYHSFKSELLSEFHKQPYTVDMAIRLPKHFKQASKKTWPVLFYISGMGGTEVEFLRLANKHEDYFDNLITVSINAMNYGGHSVFADSENTGPWASMLIKEIAPFVDQKYRGRGEKERYLTGISSGGWSSLWLQAKYPKEFSGTWSFVPDPVDFRDFQRLNLYAKGQNYYQDNLGEDRLVARTIKGIPLIKTRDFIALETALGEGGQIRSFEYVFSPRGNDGLPVQFFDRETGNINTEVIEAWKKYDIRLHLKNNWPIIKNDLKGKLNVYGGEKDQFFLEGAVRLLKEELVYLGADEDIRIIEGMGHAFDDDTVVEMLRTITSAVNTKEKNN